MVMGRSKHCRCQQNVANNCGINAKQLAAVLGQLGLAGDRTTPCSKTNPTVNTDITSDQNGCSTVSPTRS
uniref:Uncharacterized protein n=1 Tax=Haemonchus contortus TaxID=6289 RepID=W6N9P4_HAECO